MSFSKGGYQILDLTGVSEVASVVKGAYSKALSGKPVIIKNLLGVIGPTFTSIILPETASDPVQLFCTTVVEETPSVISITITSEDSVTGGIIALAVPEAAGD